MMATLRRVLWKLKKLIGEIQQHDSNPSKRGREMITLAKWGFDTLIEINRTAESNNGD